jgi:hypothetical protein
MQVLCPGDRVRLISMPTDPDPIPVGSLGTVVSVRQPSMGQHHWHQVEVDWDNGRKRMLSIPPDRVEVLPDERKA